VSTQREQETTGTPAADTTGHAIVLRQALFREVNERIEGLGGHFELVATDELEVLCECADPRCAERIELTQAEYEGVRRDPTHFIVKPGHDSSKVERVVDAKPGYAVVEKLGASDRDPVRLDPRKPTRSEGVSS
jgi:hypothetical protein